jgi:hypothetical protein
MSSTIIGYVNQSGRMRMRQKAGGRRQKLGSDDTLLSMA